MYTPPLLVTPLALPRTLPPRRTPAALALKHAIPPRQLCVEMLATFLGAFAGLIPTGGGSSPFASWDEGASGTRRPPPDPHRCLRPWARRQVLTRARGQALAT
ncbi:hypothetical protein B0H11DRAFT_2224043 [Mycena galericulata]|nr:hypothetical protein B0H11DRAFT_2224043 [Mycena galericulata]